MQDALVDERGAVEDEVRPLEVPVLEGDVEECNAPAGLLERHLAAPLSCRNHKLRAQVLTDHAERVAHRIWMVPLLEVRDGVVEQPKAIQMCAPRENVDELDAMRIDEMKVTPP